MHRYFIVTSQSRAKRLSYPCHGLSGMASAIALASFSGTQRDDLLLSFLCVDSLGNATCKIMTLANRNDFSFYVLI